MDYWKECIKEALEDAELEATDKQIDRVTEWVEGAYENYGMAHGYDVMTNPRDSRIEELHRKIKRIEEDHERRIRGVREGRF